MSWIPFAGLLAGFLSSSPIGPINLWLIESVLREKPARGLWTFVTGVIIADLVAAGVAGLSVPALQSSFAVGSYVLRAVGVGFLLLFAFQTIRSLSASPKGGQGDKEALDLETREDRFRRLKGSEGSFVLFSMGFTLCVSNPAFFLFWATALDWMMQLIAIPFGWWEWSVLLLFIGMGDALWFGLLIHYTQRSVHRFGDSLLRQIRMAMAMGMLIIAGYLGFSLIQEGLL